MIWALIARMPDVLAVIGLLTVLYWTIKFTLWIARTVQRVNAKSQTKSI